jgi:hypothetical protein
VTKTRCSDRQVDSYGMPQAATGAHRADEVHRLVSLCANGRRKGTGGAQQNEVP